MNEGLRDILRFTETRLELVSSKNFIHVEGYNFYKKDVKQYEGLPMIYMLQKNADGRT